MLHRQVDTIVFVNADDLHRYRLALIEVLVNVVDIGVSNLRNVDEAGTVLRQRNKCAKLGDPSHLSFQNGSNFKPHKLFFSLSL